MAHDVNTLQTFLKSKGIDESSAMNILQESGVISDNCVEVKDVAESDCLVAISYLNHVH